MIEHLIPLDIPAVRVPRRLEAFGLNIIVNPGLAANRFDYGLIVVVSQSLEPTAPSAALVVKARFASPVAPGPLKLEFWRQHITSGLLTALTLVSRRHSPAPRLDTVLQEASTWARNHAALMTGGGSVVIPIQPAAPSRFSQNISCHMKAPVGGSAPAFLAEDIGILLRPCGADSEQQEMTAPVRGMLNAMHIPFTQRQAPNSSNVLKMASCDGLVPKLSLSA